jgi:hypothetical protein
MSRCDGSCFDGMLYWRTQSHCPIGKDQVLLNLIAASMTNLSFSRPTTGLQGRVYKKTSSAKASLKPRQGVLKARLQSLVCPLS